MRIATACCEGGLLAKAGGMWMVSPSLVRSQARSAVEPSMRSFAPGFGPIGDEQLVTKGVNSAFIGTDLDLRLKRLGARHVVTFGISTDMCVSTTIRTGANMGWDMILADDASDCFELSDGKGGTISAEAVQAAHVATLGFEFCRVLSTSDLLAS